MASPFIDAALKWGARGFPVFPIVPRGKKPLSALVPHGLKDASKDPAVIKDWWRRAPNANIGLRTGAGKFVIDLDDDKAVAWFFDACDREGGAPSTLTVRTARGLHMFYTCGDGVPNSAGRLAPGVDVRGVGGYVVGAPSIHPSGDVYTIEHDLRIAHAPRWLVDLAILDEEPAPSPAPIRSGATGLRGVASILSLVENAREGERNRLLFWAACRLAEKVRVGLVEESEARLLLEEAGRRAGLTKVEIKATACSGFAAGVRS